MAKESIPINEAKDIIRSRISPAQSEDVYFLDAAGRYLYEDITAPYSLPLWDNSAMDGFAVNSLDLETISAGGNALTVTDEIFAGKMPEKAVERGTCARIFTGAVMPKGADAVVRQEDVALNGTKAVFKEPVSPWTDVRRKGEDVQKGAVIMKRGDRINAAAVGLLSALRISRVNVFKRPKVYIIATGSELTDVNSPFTELKIVNSNSHSLYTMCREIGAEPVMGGIVEDSRETIKKCFFDSKDSDIVITTGGVSVGEYDLVKQVFADAGVSWLFWKLKMRPGHPVAFGVSGKRLFFGLPGNPVSAMVTFDQFVRPAVMMMCGVEDPGRDRFYATVMSDIRKKPGRTHFLRAVLFAKNGELFVDVAGSQSSAALNTMTRTNCFIILEDGQTRVQKGEKVIVEVFKPC